ncbi:hypothetical protein Droror1_Dr00000011 [Drosera rotundifolia]
MEELAGSSRKCPRSCFSNDNDVDDVREPCSKKKPITWVIVDFQMSIEPDSGFCHVRCEDDDEGTGDWVGDEYYYDHWFEPRYEQERFGPFLPLGDARAIRKVAVEVESDSGFNPVWFEDEEEGSKHWLDDDYYSDHEFDSNDCDSSDAKEAFEFDTVGCGTSQEWGLCGQDNNRPVYDCYHDNGIKAVVKSDEDDEEFEEEYEEEEEGIAYAGLIEESTSSDCEGNLEKLSGKEVDVKKSSAGV